MLVKEVVQRNAEKKFIMEMEQQQLEEQQRQQEVGSLDQLFSKNVKKPRKKKAKPIVEEQPANEDEFMNYMREGPAY